MIKTSQTKNFNIIRFVVFLCFILFLYWSWGFEGHKIFKELSFNFLMIVFISSPFFLVTRRKYTSLFIAISIVSLIIFLSLKKIEAFGVNLNWSDFVLIFQNFRLTLQFTPTIPILIVCSIWLSCIFFSYKNELKSQFKLRYILGFLCVFGCIAYQLHDFKSFISTKKIEEQAYPYKTSKTLQILLAGKAHQLKVPDQEMSSAICCDKINKSDIQISNNSDIKKPHLVVVLLESTFNLQNILDFNLSDQWKDYKQRPLTVFTIGGGTWMSEYSFLHGVNPFLYSNGDLFDIFLLGPKVLEGRIAPALKQVGYKTHSVVAVGRHFLNSGDIHRTQGLDERYDESDLRTKQLPWRNPLRDQKVFEETFEILKKTKQPSFIFAKTITQHSPHSLYKTDTNPFIPCENLSHKPCKVIHEYKNREINLQNNINNFIDKINSLNDEVFVIFYGDHLPFEITDNFNENQFSNKNRKETIIFGYSNTEKKFIDIYELMNLNSCQQDFKLKNDEIDIIPLYFTHMHSKYMDQKFEKMMARCQQ